MRALFWPLIACSALAQPATVFAGTTVEGAAPASVRFFGVVPASQCCGGTKVEGASLASVCSVDASSASHCGGGHDS
jgi:hypothetical protein